MYSFNKSSVLNDLKFYSNVTRDDGPAMSFSMYAISYLDANDEQSANEMLQKSFKPYIRSPFNVWSEVSKKLISITKVPRTNLKLLSTFSIFFCLEI